ncbi:MAG: multicopper oxidase domain-containing protein [Nitrospirae bacterium]|nr:multicopper oxidase domain-containing protein [Nitrospirota bacterium]
MNVKKHFLILFLLTFLFMVSIHQSVAGVYVQCPCPAGTPISPDTGNIECTVGIRDIACRSVTSGDGYIKMADGSDMYMFGFADVTGVPEGDVMGMGMLNANFSAPTISVKEGQEFYLTLTNVGMLVRPDLFDPHTIHFHGFPNASAVFDGEPMSSVAINMGASLTYYYNLAEPGTHMYHCHVEATEHMQMGMLGNLYVRPAQDDNAGLKDIGITPPLNQPYAGFAYNDGDGSTGYHVAYPLQMAGFDPAFHWANENVQPLPFADMTDTYPMINGRGYPDTINTADILNVNLNPSQRTNALITATQGQKILLRLSSLGTVDFYTITVLGIPMNVVGQGARLLRGPDGKDLYYTTNSVTLGGGEATEVLLDTEGVAPGTYFLYTTNLNNLSNDAEDFGGMMTEIVIN